MRKNRAFTLVELLVVIGIIALLISILLPALGAARRQAAAIKCAAQMRDIGNYFKMYEIDSKGYWPVARINGWTASQPYNIDGVDYPTTNPAGGQAYWFTFLAKYATKAKAGAAVGSDVNDSSRWRKSVFFGCPAWDGYMQGGVYAGDINVVQVGYGMNPYPTFAAKYPGLLGPEFPPQITSNTQNELAIHDVGVSPTGNFLKSKTWSRPTERMLIADSKFWLAQSSRVSGATTYPPAVVAQPVLANATSNPASSHQFDAQTTVIDIYRHGTYPPSDGTFYNPNKGKISYNILYADGHVAAQSDAKEAYRSIRMKFPG
jgi:prepilin-type N-terminal cleavage/methylation domain-containing protein/prepilin-type processing-associated H-X9-DG protein